MCKLTVVGEQAKSGEEWNRSENEELRVLMKGFQIVSKAPVCFLMEADNFSIDMYSISRFFHSVTLILFLDFQFMRIVFLATIRAMERILLDLG